MIIVIFEYYLGKHRYINLNIFAIGLKKEKLDKYNESKKDMVVSKNSIIDNDIVNIGTSVAGAIVGLVLGGPTGAIIGSVISPTMTMTYNVIERAVERKRNRMIQIVEDAFHLAKMNPNEVIYLLNADNNKVDDFLNLIRIVADSDSSINSVLSSILGESLKTKTSLERERLLILGDAIRNMRSLHIRILKVLFESGGKLSAKKIALNVGIPEIELRSVVRDLELRGMIKDNGKRPLIWELRELGNNLIHFAINKI